MNKLLTKIVGVALGASMAIGVGVAVVANSGEAFAAYAAIPSTSEEAYEVTFTKGANDSGTTAPSIASGTDYATKGTTTTAYARTKGLHLGSSSNVGSQVINFTAAKGQIKATYISVYAIQVDSGKSLKTTVTYTDSSTTTNTTATGSSLAYIDIALTSTKTISSVKFESVTKSKGRVAVDSFKIYKEKASSKTLSSIALSGTYPTTFTQGDAFSHSGMTVTATYSDATTSDVTSSATFSGYNMNTAGNQTVTVSYTEGGTTKTATYGITVTAVPTISLSASSFSGYTGQQFSVTATFASLTSAFSWSESGSGTIDGSATTSGTTDGTSTYSGTLTGAGTKTLSATGGGATTKDYVITITKTTVSLNKNSTSIAQGKSETLTATSNAGSSFTWNSSNTAAATVSNGVVSVPSGATVGATSTITATSTVDTSVSAACTVTVTEKELEATYDFVTNFSSYNDGWTNSYANHEGINGKTQLGGDYAATVDLYYASKQTGTITDRPVFATKTESGSWTKVVGFELTESGYKIKEVQVTFAQWNTKTPDVALFSGDEASGTPLDSGTIGTKNTISTSNLNGTTFTVGYCDKNTGSNVQSGLTSIYITLAKDNALDHVTVSFASDPADRTFTAGSTFAFNGTLTASYTVDSPKAVTPSGYFLEGEEGTGEAITTSTVLTVADFNGGDVYVQYKEGGITKYDTFTLIVNPAPATSVTLSSDTGTVALEEVFEVSSITATVNPQAYATQGVTWEVYDSDGLVEGSTYMFDGAEFYATQPADVVFHVKANSNGSIYASFTLTITGEPMAHLLDDESTDVTDGSATVFGDVGTLTYGITTENFKGSISYAWSTSNSSIISIDDDQGDMCDFYVEGVGGSARLSCRVRGSDKGDVTVYIDVTVTAVTVTSVTWTAPTINVYSGATLSSTSGWNVKYSTNSGKTDQTPDSFKVVLGGSEISLPYEWKASDDGKALGVQVGGTNSSTTNVSVTQSLRPVYAPTTESNTVSWTATAAANLGSQISSQGETDEGTISTGSFEWNYTRTLVGLANNKSDYIAFQGNTWIQLGSGNALESIEFTTSAIPGNIKSVSVVAATAGTHALTIDVGGTKYLEDESLHVYTGTAAAANPDPNDCVKTGTGSSSGAITITIAQSGSTRKAMVIRSISVTYETGSSEEVNIANVAGHEAAQKAVVKFAKAFNAAMDTTSGCTTNMSSAWSTASGAWTTFLSEAAALGEAEEAYAKKLVKNATAQWTEDTDSDYEYCLERAMATYEKCVADYGMTPFMTPVRTLPSNSSHISGYLSGINSSNVYAIAITMSMITFTVVGGYFFLRKKKEEK